MANGADAACLLSSVDTVMETATESGDDQTHKHGPSTFFTHYIFINISLRVRGGSSARPPVAMHAMCCTFTTRRRQGGKRQAAHGTRRRTQRTRTCANELQLSLTGNGVYEHDQKCGYPFQFRGNCGVPVQVGLISSSCLVTSSLPESRTQPYRSGSDLLTDGTRFGEQRRRHQ